MILDIEMLRSFYASYSESVAQAKATVKRPLTYVEKVLFAHLFDPTQLRSYKRGVEYVDFRPNRVAMQDATAQMALLQFMNAGKDKVAVPASVHCDHLIRADVGATQDLPEACKTNKEVYDFLKSVFSEIPYRILGTWCRNHPSGSARKLCIPWRYDGGYRFSYS